MANHPRRSSTRKIPQAPREKQTAKPPHSVRHVLMVQAFNEWRRRFIEDPKAFDREFEHRADYGAACAAYLEKLMSELKGA